MLFAVIVFIKIKFSFYHKLLILALKGVKVYPLLAEDERFLSMGSFPVYSTLCTALVTTVELHSFPFHLCALLYPAWCSQQSLAPVLGQNLRKKPTSVRLELQFLFGCVCWGSPEAVLPGDTSLCPFPTCDAVPFGEMLERFGQGEVAMCSGGGRAEPRRAASSLAPIYYIL